MPTETADILLSEGLAGQDDNIDILLRLWNELQSSAVDAAQAPIPDLFSFAESTCFLGVIMEKRKPDVNKTIQPNWPARSPEQSPAVDKPPHVAPPPYAAQFEKMHDDESLVELWIREQLYGEGNRSPGAYGRDSRGAGEACSHSIQKSPIGLLYLISTPRVNAPAGDTNIGIILDAASRGRGYARQALELVLTWAFDDVRFHRVQAAILESPEKPKALSLFTQMYVHSFFMQLRF